jgi:hypothetical protein
MAAGVGWFVYESAAQRRWYRQVEYQILRLAPKPPADATPEQWAVCVTWVWNLHSNYGQASYFPEEKRAPFLRELQQRVDGPVTFDTIDWFWDEYARCATPAANYSHFRPNTAEMREDGGIHPALSAEPLEFWIAELRRREQAGE